MRGRQKTGYETTSSHFFDYIKSEEDAFDLLMQLTYGLNYLHKLGFYHCDIAPKNIFLRKYDDYTQLVIGDLGAGITIEALLILYSFSVI